MAEPAQIESVVRYYAATTFGYHAVWTGRRDLALHFGYQEPARPLSHRASLLNMNAALAARAGIGPGDRVLDAGCGYGGSALWLAASIGCAVVGINVVPF